MNFVNESGMRISQNKFAGVPKASRPVPEDSGLAFAARGALDLAALNSLDQAQIEGEPDIIVELIDLYIEDASNKLRMMRLALSSSDDATLMRAAHSLKGSSSSLGAWGVAAICEELERAGCADTRNAESLGRWLEQEFECVRQALMVERRKRNAFERK